MKKMRRILAILMATLVLMSSVGLAASAASLRKLDLAFVVDTTGSMDDDIAQVKADMKEYLNDLNESGMDYKIAIVDYRDFPARSVSEDYPYRVQIDFTSDHDAILATIDALNVDGGGDWRETIYSALIDGVNELSWRSDAGKAAILMGDAPALDPEPYTNYTADDAIANLKNGNIAAEDRVKSASFVAANAVVPMANERSSITLFAIATSSDAEVVENFNYLAEGTGGKTYTLTSGVADISDIIKEIIETIPDVVVNPQLTLWERIKAFFLKVWYFITFQWSKLA